MASNSMWFEMAMLGETYIYLNAALCVCLLICTFVHSTDFVHGLFRSSTHFKLLSPRTSVPSIGIGCCFFLFVQVVWPSPLMCFFSFKFCLSFARSLVHLFDQLFFDCFNILLVWLAKCMHTYIFMNECVYVDETHYMAQWTAQHSTLEIVYAWHAHYWIMCVLGPRAHLLYLCMCCACVSFSLLRPILTVRSLGMSPKSVSLWACVVHTYTHFSLLTSYLLLFSSSFSCSVLVK